MSSLKHLFRTYLNEDDSWEDYELRKRPVVASVATTEVVPVQPVMVPVTEPAAAVAATRTVEVAAVYNYGIQPVWFSDVWARKSSGPQLIHISFVEFFYDLIFAIVMSTFAYNIAFGWPNGKWLNFVEMLVLLDLWYNHVNFHCVVHAQDGVSRTLIFLQMIGVLGLAFFRNIFVNGGGSTLTGFVVSFFWARFFQLLLYIGVIANPRAPASTRLCFTIWLCITALTCIPMAVSVGLRNDLSTYGAVMIWLIGIGIDLLALAVLPLVPWWATAWPIATLKRFRDRFGAFMIFFFIYMLTALFFDETGPFGAGEWASIALSFLIAFCFMWMYYDSERHDDDVADIIHPLSRGVFVFPRLWQLLHLPLAGALIILADASVQYVYYYRSIVRLPNTVVPIISNGQPALVLSNSVQWIYGISFAVALALITIIGLLYQYETRRVAKYRLERSLGRFALVVVMVLIPLGGLNGPMEPIIQLIVGAVVMFILVVIDWSLNVAFATVRQAETVVAVVPASSSPMEAQRMRELEVAVAERDARIAELQKELAKAGAGGVAVPAGAVGAVPVDNVESEISSSKDWGFTSRTSSVVEDVVASSEADESQQFETEERVDMGGANNNQGENTETEPASSTTGAGGNNNNNSSGAQ